MSGSASLPSADPLRHLHAAMHVEEAIGLIQTPRPQNHPMGFGDDVGVSHYE
jgi:hypothetical protein